MIQNPFFEKIERVKRYMRVLEQVKDLRSAEDFMCDHVIRLRGNAYRKRIKGFHLSFSASSKVS